MGLGGVATAKVADFRNWSGSVGGVVRGRICAPKGHPKVEGQRPGKGNALEKACKNEGSPEGAVERADRIFAIALGASGNWSNFAKKVFRVMG